MKKNNVGDTNIGDTVQLAGYDEMARAAHDMGNVLVLCNASDWFLVVATFEPEGPEATEGKLVAAFEYGDCYQSAYVAALKAMVDAVAGRI